MEFSETVCGRPVTLPGWCCGYPGSISGCGPHCDQKSCFICIWPACWPQQAQWPVKRQFQGQRVSMKGSVGAPWLLNVSLTLWAGGPAAFSVAGAGGGGTPASCTLCGQRPMESVPVSLLSLWQSWLSWSSRSLRPRVTGLLQAPVSPLFGEDQTVQGDREKTREDKH